MKREGRERDLGGLLRPPRDRFRQDPDVFQASTATACVESPRVLFGRQTSVPLVARDGDEQEVEDVDQDEECPLLPARLPAAQRDGDKR
jgi:hypothetical protein